MAHNNWEADRMLDVYIYDYLVKKKLHATAKSEGKVAPDPVAIDAPGGFLFEWWSIFWDFFITRTNKKHIESAASYIEAQQNKVRGQQQIQMQQFQQMHQDQLQRRDLHRPNLTVTGQMNAINSEGMLGQPTVSALAAKMYEERMRNANTMDFETIQSLFDTGAAHMKSAANSPGQLVQGNPSSVTAPLQQMHARMHQTPDTSIEANTVMRQRSLPMGPSVYGQGVKQSKPGKRNSGLNPGVGGIQLKGWPLTGIDLLRPSLGAQYQKALLQNSSQYRLLTQQQQQQLLAQVQAQGNLSNPSMHGDMNPSRIGGLPRGTSGAKDGQSMINESSMGSPVQSTSQMKMHKKQQSSSKQHQNPLQQSNRKRKRKGPMSSGPANSTSTEHTVDPSPNSQPSTPSAHTPAEGAAMTSNLQHVNGIPKSTMMYAADGTAGVASSTNQLEGMEHFGDVGSFDDDVESYLSHDDECGRELFETLEKTEHVPETSKGFSFSEVGSIRSSNSKVVCCHFSSDGKFLASAGHDRKVVLWNMETLQTESTPEEHTHIITDVRFRPNSTQLATSSFDTTVRLWDAAEPGYCLQVYKGHTSHAVSLDFHPKKNDIFCSCDVNDEIHLWNIDQNSCARVFKGGSTQVRFQPRIGKLLAAASENVVSIFDVEADTQIHSFQGHSTEVDSLCWDANGEYLASVSQEYVKVWSLASGECIHELSSSGNKFHSCVFHPSYPALLVIGAYQSLELWNMSQNKCMTIEAHNCVVSGLAQSQVMGMVASASHDKSVKIWK